jgi:hypothetical protein
MSDHPYSVVKRVISILAPRIAFRFAGGNSDDFSNAGACIRGVERVIYVFYHQENWYRAVHKAFEYVTQSLASIVHRKNNRAPPHPHFEMRVMRRPGQQCERDGEVGMLPLRALIERAGFAIFDLQSCS